jgi:uncharacterized protein YyaL (SSP411 family)
MSNQLAGELSPYLLQHADNPVDWMPWGEEALAKAAKEDKPIFVSIGYATCHWCHVMAHESFEDAEVAEVLNQHFVSIKIDREERPDLDSVFMLVCQTLTGSGGWPSTLFLTPDQKPFFAGTYFPKQPMPGRPGFLPLVEEIARRWRDNPAELIEAANKVTQAVTPRPPDIQVNLDESVLEKAYWQLARSYDPKYGGFGRAPKFPTPHNLVFLLRWHQKHPDSKALGMVTHTLSAMRKGGIFDHLGKGFHRYSVDERWLVPHFEKMLYDQAQLAMAYLEAYQASRQDYYAQAAREIFEYVLRDLTSPQGAFYAAEDADSQGEEGTYYVWTPEQLEKVLDRETTGLVRRYYGVTNQGNFENGASILWERVGLEEFARHGGEDPQDLKARLASAREKLLKARGGRERPLRDDKILTAWNGLMIAALAMGGRILKAPGYTKAADRATDFLWDNLQHNGRLLRRFRGGQAGGDGFLDDYAFFTWGLIELYETGGDPAHLERAKTLMQSALDHHWDQLHKGFYFTAHEGEKLLFREKDIYDGAMPSGNAVSAYNLLRLSRLAEEPLWLERAWQLMKHFSAQVCQHPMAYTQFMLALDLALEMKSPHT